MGNIKFGTAGFRGVIADTFTKENVMRIGAAFQNIVNAEKKNVSVIVGYDNRFMGKEFAQWFCEAFCCDRARVTLMTKSVPTNYIAFRTVECDYGIMFSASHNPPCYSGIKVFLHGGKDADDAFSAKLENAIEALPPEFPTAKFDDLVKSKKITMRDSVDDYVDKIVSALDAAKIAKSKLRVLFNPLHGSSIECVQKLFAKLGLEYHAINDNPDPYFGGELPAAYPRQLGGMAKTVSENGYDFGFALDGDGDRITVVDSNGKIYDCNYLLALFYYYLVEIKKLKGGLAKNFTSSNLSTRVAKKYGSEIHETRVGFKFLAVPMEQGKALIAGEGGGVGFRGISLTKDGIVAAANLIDLMVNMKKSITAMIDEITRLVDFPSFCLEYAYPYDAAVKEELLGKIKSDKAPKFAHTVVGRKDYPDGFKIFFENDYWAVARTSGTENVVRFYTEMKNAAEAEKVIKAMEDFYGLCERQK